MEEVVDAEKDDDVEAPSDGAASDSSAPPILALTPAAPGDVGIKGGQSDVVSHGSSSSSSARSKKSSTPALKNGADAKAFGDFRDLHESALDSPLNAGFRGAAQGKEQIRGFVGWVVMIKPQSNSESCVGDVEEDRERMRDKAKI